MKPTLQLKLSQHLTLTPQLQQSIRLLQLSTLELNAEVERMLQENPLLEKAEGDDEAAPVELPHIASPPTPEAEARAERRDDGDLPPDRERPTDATERTEGVDRADFDDYSSGESDWGGSGSTDDDDGFFPQQVAARSEERRVGKECRSRWSPY